ncbi:MAG: DUF1858 domain-containing protein [Acidobacteriia bacterium]|nr:DUF1858 domain-containing protein [Terriglobia bacterium]
MSTSLAKENEVLTVDAIGSNTNIRAIIAAFPQTVELFTRYGLMGCGGERGPDEPLQWFAVVHNINPQTLISEVKEFIRTEPLQKEASAQGPQEIPLYKRFIFAALAFTLTGGVVWGVINLTLIAIHRDFPKWLDPSNQAHGHVQIFGWVSLFIMGVAYHVVPRMKATKLWNEFFAETSFVLMAAGVLLRGIFQPLMAGNTHIAGIVITSALLELVAIGLFVLIILKTLQSSPQSNEGFEKYLMAGSTWFLLMGLANVGIVMTMAAQNSNSIPEALNWSLRHLQLDGFITMFIFGIGRRTVGVFMGKKSPNNTLDRWVFGSWNAALMARMAADLMMHQAATPWARGLLLASASVELLAIVGFIYNLHIFGKSTVDLSGTPLPRDYEKFVYQSYAWLAAATVMIFSFSIYQFMTGQVVAHALMGAYRHALTVGFITMMIMGYSNRIVPVFTGHRIYSTRLLNAAFVFMTAGNLLRVAFQALTVPFGKSMFLVAGTSGYFELIGLCLFAYNLVATIQGRADVRAAVEKKMAGPISASWTVAQVLASYPATLDVFLNFGFDQLRNPVLRKTMAHAVTVEQAARIKNLDARLLVSTLNKVRDMLASQSAA